MPETTNTPDTPAAAPALDDDVRALREALAAGPTPGEWRYNELLQTILGRSVGGCNLQEDTFKLADIRGWGHLQYLPNGEAIQDANGMFMATASPDRIARVLDALEREREQVSTLERTYNQLFDATVQQQELLLQLQRERDEARAELEQLRAAPRGRMVPVVPADVLNMVDRPVRGAGGTT